MRLRIFLTTPLLAMLTWRTVTAYPQYGVPPGAPNPVPPIPPANYPNYPNYPRVAPLPPYAVPYVPIVEQSFDIDPAGGYRWSFSSADGTAQEAQGAPTGPNGAVVSRGSAQWAGTDGPVRLDYVADEFGYQPVGTHVHPNIARAVAQQVAAAKAETAALPVPVPPEPIPPLPNT